MNIPLVYENEQAHKTGRRIVMDVRAVTKSLPLGRERVEILKGISFQIMSGEFVSIVGPSGSGKSTLLGIIAGLDNPTTGQVLIDGVDITSSGGVKQAADRICPCCGQSFLVDIARMTEGELATVRNSRIGMVFQAYNLIPTLTAQENVEVPLYVGKHKGSPSARAQELLTLVGLSHRFNHRPNQLSGGEQQRVAIARALATDPAFVIADEPTGNLDARNGENILKLIADLRSQTGKTFIIATHDPVVASHADRAIRIVDGKIAEIDYSKSAITQ
jgi:putative ABC transport system ATP-binding protein